MNKTSILDLLKMTGLLVIALTCTATLYFITPYFGSNILTLIVSWIIKIILIVITIPLTFIIYSIFVIIPTKKTHS